MARYSARSVTNGETRAALKDLVTNRTTLTVILSLLLGALLIANPLQVYLNQIREIQLAEEAIEQAKQDVIDMEIERDRWRDPNFIRAQARDRLYYVMPGEVSYLVMNADSADLSAITLGEVLAAKRNASAISGQVSATDANWIHSVVESVLRSSLEDATEVSAD